MKTIWIVPNAAALFLVAAALRSTSAYAAPPRPILPLSQYGQEGGWEAPPAELNEIQRRGFHDGVDGARRDFDNHRPPNVENRDEYRSANFPPEMREAYRDGYRRGYNIAVSHIYPQPGMQPAPTMQPGPPGQMRPWEGNQPVFNEFQRRGFEDGKIGARRDADNHRRPDPNNRDEYRDPHVPPQFIEDYREGFRRGYEETVYQLMGGTEEGPVGRGAGGSSARSRGVVFKTG